MKTEIKIENCSQPFCVIHTPEKTEQIQKLAEKISMIDSSGKQIFINGWDKDFCIPLKASDIYRVYSFDKKVFVETQNEALLLKMRLYEFENFCNDYAFLDFIRISNTDIINIKHVKFFDMSLTSVIKVNFSNGKNAIVSRRYMSKIKEKLCLKK